MKAFLERFTLIVAGGDKDRTIRLYRSCLEVEVNAMRRYIPKEQLILMLHQIIDSENPELHSIYKQIILLRTTKDTKTYSHAVNMLICPRLITLSILNIFALSFAGIYFNSALQTSLPAGFSGVCLLLIIAFTFAEGFRLIRLLGQIRQAMRYVLVDELFARKILVLQKPQETQTAKAAK